MRCRYPSGEVVGAEDDGSYSVPTKDGTERETSAGRCQNLQENILQGLDWLTAEASKARDTSIASVSFAITGKGDCLTLIYCGRAVQARG